MVLGNRCSFNAFLGAQSEAVHTFVEGEARSQRVAGIGFQQQFNHHIARERVGTIEGAGFRIAGNQLFKLGPVGAVVRDLGHWGLCLSRAEASQGDNE